MNIFDDMPDIGKCPHCGHEGEGLQFAFPDSGFSRSTDVVQAQAACLSCGAHGPARPSYAAAVAAFKAGELEVA